MRSSSFVGGFSSFFPARALLGSMLCFTVDSIVSFFVFVLGELPLFERWRPANSPPSLLELAALVIGGVSVPSAGGAESGSKDLGLG